MPAVYEGAVQDLIDEFGELPGIGPKSAQRMAFHILSADSASVERLIEALRAVKARVRFCRTCGNISESEQCAICRDPRRDQRIICVVEEPKDVVAIERTRARARPARRPSPRRPSMTTSPARTTRTPRRPAWSASRWSNGCWGPRCWRRSP